MNTFDGCCGSCIHMNTNEYTGHKSHCYCTYRGQYYNLDEKKCRYYEYDRYKDYYDLNRRWHIVSTIFKKLDLKDSYECIALLHNFRKDYVEKDEKYNALLEEYDKLAPVIARCIDLDVDSKELCQKIAQYCLLDMLNYIKEGKKEEAVVKYVQMFNLLKEIYSVQINEYVIKKNSKK